MSQVSARPHKMRVLRAIFYSLFGIFAASSAFASCQHVIQNGTVINGAAVVFIANCTIGQAGGSAGSTIVNGLPMITDLGVMGKFGILDAPITGAYHQALESWQGSNFVIQLNSAGGAGTPAAFLQINGGPLEPLPGGGGGGNISGLITPHAVSGRPTSPWKFAKN